MLKHVSAKRRTKVNRPKNLKKKKQQKHTKKKRKKEVLTSLVKKTLALYIKIYKYIYIYIYMSKKNKGLPQNGLTSSETDYYAPHLDFLFPFTIRLSLFTQLVA